jgi:hypothetical protein
MVKVCVDYETLSSGERIAFVGCEAYGVLRATIEGERQYTTTLPAHLRSLHHEDTEVLIQ